MAHQILSSIQVDARTCQIDVPDESTSIMESKFDPTHKMTSAYLVSRGHHEANRPPLGCVSRANPAQRPRPTALRAQRVPHATRGLLHADIMTCHEANRPPLGCVSRANPAQRPHPTASRAQRVPHAPRGLLHADQRHTTARRLSCSRSDGSDPKHGSDPKYGSDPK